MLNLQSIVQQLSHSSNEMLLHTVAVPIMRAQEQMLSLGQVLYFRGCKQLTASGNLVKRYTCISDAWKTAIGG